MTEPHRCHACGAPLRGELVVVGLTADEAEKVRTAVCNRERTKDEALALLSPAGKDGNARIEAFDTEFVPGCDTEGL